MTVGNQPSAANLNNLLTIYSTELRDLCFKIGNLQKYMTSQGTAGLVGNVGYAGTADAALAMTMASYLNTFQLIFYGTGTQGTAFDFSNALAPLSGGQ